MAVGKKGERQRLYGVAECVKLAMTTQLLPKGRRSFSQLLSGQPVGVVAVRCPPNTSRLDGTKSKVSVNCSLKQHSRISVTSSDASDSAIASRKDDDSDAESLSWRAKEAIGNHSALQLSMVHVNMEPCTVAEKVQRWKDTMNRPKTRARGTERPLVATSQRSTDSSCYRDSLDSGLHSLSMSSWPGTSTSDQQINVVQQAQAEGKPSQQVQSRRPGSPSSGQEAGADDTLTSASALSSFASDGEGVETTNDDSRPPSDCSELETANLKEVGYHSLSRTRSDIDSLLTDRRTSNGGDSWYSLGVGGTTEDETAGDKRDDRCKSLPATNGYRPWIAEEQDSQEIARFMQEFVVKIFEDYGSLSPGDKSRFGELATIPEGRSAFARSLDGYRAGRSCLTEGSFLSLAQSTAVILFESCEAGDWSPAKVLMNMCFTFYTEEVQNDGSIQREHLYSQLSSQPIWKNRRFWEAAFFEAILSERAKFLLPSAPSPNCLTEQQNNELNETGPRLSEVTSQPQQRPDKESQRQCLENVTFSQLAAFTHNMHAFGLPAQMCLQFLEKQLVIGGLPPGQEQLLRENVESLYRLQPKET